MIQEVLSLCNTCKDEPNMCVLKAVLCGTADNICNTAKAGLNEMARQSKDVHDMVMESTKPVAKTTFKFPMYNQVPQSNNGPVRR